MATLLKSLVVVPSVLLTTDGSYMETSKYLKSENGMLGYLVNLLSTYPKEYSSFYMKLKLESHGRIKDTRNSIPMPFDDTCQWRIQDFP